ncbi:MAG: hypothetical protein DME22_26695, partial [Verrucomicrobia bacterium]
LALIAANVARGGSLKPREAIAYAAELYDEACARLEHAMKLQDAYTREASMFADIPHPEKFPASFDDFLRLIVRAKTPADATKRFRDFLRDRVKRSCVFDKIEDYPVWAEWAGKKIFEQMKPEERENPQWAGMTEQEIGAALQQENLEKRVAEQLEEYACGFQDQYRWGHCAKGYFAWWARQRSDQARAAAKKSKKSA